MYSSVLLPLDGRRTIPTVAFRLQESRPGTTNPIGSGSSFILLHRNQSLGEGKHEQSSWRREGEKNLQSAAGRLFPHIPC